MRFLLNFVSCCGAVPYGHVVAPPTVPPLAKKPSSLVPASCEGNKHRRRVKLDGRPSLRTISEDDVVNVEKAKGSARPRNKKIGNFESTANSQYSRNTSEIWYQSLYQASIPTFSPAPFVF
ncbi:hypothetical protein F0562_018947 [Nyssa sinensis]|uniref:Uncharacterized protein n=1 Tax=Nyssa sinensis TaxID=561372 RepID=A0A5J4ZCI6_9ASTE|nr:hypothetical protein F0562_018947 [Nyssa sinensis]